MRQVRLDTLRESGQQRIRLAAGRPGQELTKRHQIRVGSFINPAAAHDELFAKISDVGDRSAKTAEPQLEEYLERGAGRRRFNHDYTGAVRASPVACDCASASKLLVTVEQCQAWIVSPLGLDGWRLMLLVPTIGAIFTW